MQASLVACPSCGAQLRLKDSHKPGVKVKCPRCARVFAVVGREEASKGPPSAHGDTEGGVNPQEMETLLSTQDDSEGKEKSHPARESNELGRLGPNRLLEILGEGGMGTVYRAEDSQLRRQVALKVMLPKYASNARARERFLREARAAAAIEHEHIVAIYHVGEGKAPGTPPTFTAPELAGPAPGDPVSPVALVSKPAPIKGVRSWTIETREPRIRHHAMALSPDGSTLAACNADGTVHLLKASNRKLMGILVGHGCRVHAVCWSPDGKRLLTHDPTGQARVWKAASGTLLNSFRIPYWDSRVSGQSFGWSPDGTLLAMGTQDGEICLYDGFTCQEIDRLHGHRGYVLSLSWSPNSRLLATADEHDRVLVWDIAEGQPTRWLSGKAAAWSPDGKRLATGGMDKTVRIWDAASGALLSSYEGHIAPVVAVAWSPDGTLFASGAELMSMNSENTVMVRDGNNGRVLQTFPMGAWYGVRTLTFTPDRQLLVGYAGNDDGQGGNRTACHTTLWDVRSGSPFNLPARSGQQRPMVAWHPTLPSLYLHTSRQLDVWDDEAGTLRPLSATEFDWPSRLWMLADGKSLGLLERNRIAYFDMSGKGRQVSPPRPSSDGALACSPSGTRYAAIEPKNCIAVYKVGEEKPLFALSGHSEHINNLAWSPDGKMLASISHDKSVRLWDLEKGACVQVLTADLPQDAHHWRDVFWSPDGKKIAAAIYGYIQIWDTDTGKSLRRFLLEPAWTVTVDWSPDGQFLAAGGIGCRTRIWNVRTGELLRTSWHTQSTAQVRWSPNGKTVAVSGSEDLVRFVDGAKGEGLGVLMRFANGKHLAISADGHYCGSADIQRDLVHIVITDAGQETLAPEEFSKRFGWKNDPTKVRLFSR